MWLVNWLNQRTFDQVLFIKMMEQRTGSHVDQLLQELTPQRVQKNGF